MKNSILLFLFLTTLFSCQSQPISEGRRTFEEELSSEIIDEIEANSPFNSIESISVQYNYKGYFEMFGNSGLMILYQLDEKTTKIIDNEISKFQKLNNDLLKLEESNYVFKYQNSEIKIPEISEDFVELKSNLSPKDKEVEIILLKKGTFKNAFKNTESKKESVTKYSTGIFILKDQKKVIYWFLLYS